MSAPKTLFDKIWEAHVVHQQEDGTCLIYIDRHLVHEVTSPQAFEGLRNTGRAVRSPERTLAVADHNVPTTDRSQGIADEESRIQVETLAQNAADFGVPYFAMNDIRQGIVHVIGPEQGFTQPGMTIVCGDSHTATHGASGALAWQCLSILNLLGKSPHRYCWRTALHHRADVRQRSDTSRLSWWGGEQLPVRCRARYSLRLCSELSRASW